MKAQVFVDNEPRTRPLPFARAMEAAEQHAVETVRQTGREAVAEVLQGSRTRAFVIAGADGAMEKIDLGYQPTMAACGGD